MPLGRRGGGRGDKRAQQALASAVIGRVNRADDGAEAVRRVLARTELERPVRKVAIVDVADARLAGGIAAALRDERPVTAGPARVVGLDGVDAVVAVVPAKLAPAAALVELERVRDLLLGVLLIGGAPVAAAREAPAPESDDDPLAALNALERAAGPVDPAALRPAPMHTPMPTPTPAPERKAQPVPAESDLREARERAEALESELRDARERAERAEAALEARSGELSQHETELVATRERAERAEARATELEERLGAASQESTRAAELEAQLESRLAELSQREAALERIRETLAQRQPEPAPEAAPAPAPEAEQRGGLFGRRRRPAPQADTETEALRARIAELEQAHAEPPQLLPHPEPEPETEAQATAAPAPLTLAPLTGRPTIFDLERLVDDARTRGMAEAEEWEPYVPLLRQHAGTDGSIPFEFDDLLRDVFGSAVSV